MGQGRHQPPPGILRNGKYRQTKVSFAQMPPAEDTPPPTAQLSLSDAVTDCFRFDVQSLADDL
jgi:hypothetical protein